MNISKRVMYEMQKMAVTTSPEFYGLMFSVIDSSLRLRDCKFIIKENFPELLPFVTDDIIEKNARLYHLIKKLQQCKFPIKKVKKNVVCCVMCDSKTKPENICSHGVADGICCCCEKCHDELEEESDEEIMCYGKHCEETEGLKLAMAWCRNFGLNGGIMVMQQFLCENCYLEKTGHSCRSCSDYFPYTEMEYKKGGAFGDSSSRQNQFFCKPCVKNISACDYYA
jgi:hypothetical protein